MSMLSARQHADLLADLLHRERDAFAEFLSALADFDRRRAWVELGHASLFAFLVIDLGLSNGAAAYRRAAVDLIERFPQVLEHLRSGRLCLTTVFELSKVLTTENASEVLPRFLGTSRREAKNVVAELAPEPAQVRTVVTAVHAPPLAPAPLPTTALTDSDVATGRPADHVRANSDPVPQEGRELPLTALPPAPTVVEPKTAELSRLHLTVPRRLLAKLAAARAALSHSHPGASDADLIEAGLDLILQRHARRRGIGAKPRKPAHPGTTSSPEPTAAELSEAPRSRHVPADVWRAVWERDRGCCAWPLEGGGVCKSTLRVQLDHVDGFALGGETSVERCRLLCAFHQDLHARALYGPGCMDRFTRPKGGRFSEPAAVYGAWRHDAPVIARSSASREVAALSAWSPSWSSAPVGASSRRAPAAVAAPSRLSQRLVDPLVDLVPVLVRRLARIPLEPRAPLGELRAADALDLRLPTEEGRDVLHVARRVPEHRRVP
jgi:hypothetical protein